MKREAGKLFALRKNGTIGPLFINKKQVVPMGEWMEAETHPTKGFAVRHGWHCTSEKRAPHLSEKGRVWARVEIEGFEEFKRPDAQGGLWFIAERMRVLEVVK